MAQNVKRDEARSITIVMPAIAVRRTASLRWPMGGHPVSQSASDSISDALEYWVPAFAGTTCGDLHVDASRQRVVLDELAARLDQVAHQLGEDVVGLVDLLDLHLQQRARIDVQRGLPQLLRVHLAETFVALHGDALAAEIRHRIEQ